jgi:hypothetical protein
MQRLVSISMVVLVGLLASTAVAAQDRRYKDSPKCPPANEGVLFADAQATVYNAATVVYEGRKREAGPRGVFGCAYGAKQPYYLGRGSQAGASGSVSTYPIVLAGPVVAYGEGSSFAYGKSSEEVWVRNLRTGKLIHQMPNGSPAEAGDVGLGETTAIVVKSNGSVAWIVRTTEGLQVRSLDKSGSHLLAAAAEIDPGSLALAGSTLYWTQAGRPMSAPLQ